MEDEFIELARDEDVVPPNDMTSNDIFTEDEQSDDDHEGTPEKRTIEYDFPVDSVAELALDITERLTSKKNLKRKTKLADALIHANVIESNLKTSLNHVNDASKILDCATSVKNLAREASKSVLSKAKTDVQTQKEEKTPKKESESAGRKWFGMKSMAGRPGAKEAVELLKMRGYMDPKKFFKKDSKMEKEFPKVFQLGTVTTGAHEFYSARLTKKERAPSIVEEILRDKEKLHYVKKKFEDVQKANPRQKAMRPFTQKKISKKVRKVARK